MDIKPEEHPKGSLWLVLIFFAVFMLMYLLNWGLLMQIWQVG